ncbi:hypothetical protein BDP27DRAFT_1371365 [Rhodocollybia butyracea]|uniref:Uncharacterized protein n=1 Tax=Rhodocollybia butyracea TaxID=206335 RepID=A0A9P5TYS9_9AGAR|nr:hypothetical protein BDP27DRAFT_1371365 [Rhodocollybia butyracea]
MSYDQRFTSSPPCQALPVNPSLNKLSLFNPSTMFYGSKTSSLHYLLKFNQYGPACLTQDILLSCRGLYFTAYFFAILSILRVYALFGQKRSLLILLCPFVIADIVDAFLAWFSTTVTASQGTYAEPFSSCFWGGNSSELEICQLIYILAEVLLLLLRLTFESIIFILTLIRTVHHLMQTRKYGINSIAEVVLRNGILYFFTIFITTSIPATFVLSDTVFSGGMILNKAEGVTFMFNASSLNVFANLLINRFVLNLRAFSHRTVQSSSKGSSNTNTPTLSALSFAESRFIGNMGAPLDFHQWDEVEDPETEVEREEGHIE